MNEDTAALLKRIDDATNAIADKIKALIAKATEAGNVTAAEINAALGPEVATLEALGKAE